MSEARVFVCIASYEPDATLLDRQLASLTAQTLTNWRGVIVDDASSAARREALVRRCAAEPRVRLVLATERLGFYRNFERALAEVPPDVPFVALCDQDDHWHPQKLARQVEALESSAAALCYADLRLVDRAGALVAPSFWSGRPHDRSLRGLVYNNVVTGATALFRRELLDLALPFPVDAGGAFHDHWLALCAAMSAGLVYLDEPLVDYTQHDGNVLGAQGLSDIGPRATRQLLERGLRELFTAPGQLSSRLDRLATHAVQLSARLRVFAAALAQRASLGAEARRALRPFLDPSPMRALLDLVGPTLLATVVAGEATNLEPLKIPVGLLWHKATGSRG